MDRWAVIESRRQAEESERREAREYIEMWEKKEPVSKDCMWRYVVLPVPVRCGDCGHVMRCGGRPRLVRSEKEKDPHGLTLGLKNFFRCCECSFEIMLKKGSPTARHEVTGGEVASAVEVQ